MRWDRLFDDLEASAEDVVRDERDVLADDLRDELLAERSWADGLAGAVLVSVHGAGDVEGAVAGVAEEFVHLETGHEDVLVARSAVMAVSGAGRGSARRSRVGWGGVFRAARDDGDPVRVLRRDGQQVEGEVIAAAADAVVLRTPSGRDVTIPWSAIALVRRRR
ncbi:hypothetical protein D9V41_14560 [Aeromicrobium phragmitis]|uniref:Uncharacterized protein n=1 Tax=Aeromicrobium phragmitis TaxID=2478914 RepID=A0A3L8PL67_9ACTN|nr:hypothetical protein [Aeromicrobium phragmitis]RLV54812.1 hypothetical protein D9V41_14560 [Aeromicrobium phragmitis]